jgi:hypothetical protein
MVTDFSEEHSVFVFKVRKYLENEERMFITQLNI